MAAVAAAEVEQGVVTSKISTMVPGAELPVLSAVPRSSTDEQSCGTTAATSDASADGVFHEPLTQLYEYVISAE